MKNIRNKFKRIIFESQNIKEALITATFLRFISRILGYFRNLMIAVWIGYGFGTDAYFMAISIAGIFMIFTDVFDTLGVPTIVNEKAKGNKNYERMLRTLLTFTVLLATVLSALAILLAPVLPYIAVGMSLKAKTITEYMILLLTPYIFSSFIFHHFGAIFRADNKYQYFYIAQFIISTVSLVSFFLLIKLLGATPYFIPISMSLGTLAGTIFLVVLGRENLKFGIKLNDTTKKLVHEFLFLSLLYSLGIISGVVDKIYASILPSKSITALGFGTMITGAVLSITGFGNVFITRLSESNGEKYVFTKFLNFNLFIMIPIVFFIYFNAHEITKIIFGYGLVTSKEINITSIVIKYFAFMIPLAGIWAIIFREIQILKRLDIFLIGSPLFILITIIANYIFVVTLKYGLLGIALGTITSYLFIIIYCFYFLNKWDKVDIKKLLLVRYDMLFLVIAAIFFLSRYLEIKNLYFDIIFKGLIFGLFFLFFIFFEFHKKKSYNNLY